MSGAAWRICADGIRLCIAASSCESDLQMDERMDEEWQRRLQEAWLMVVEGHPDRYANLFSVPHMRGDRYVKWLLTNTHALDLDEMENVKHFEVGLLATTDRGMLNRLEDERDSFLGTLDRLRAAA